MQRQRGRVGCAWESVAVALVVGVFLVGPTESADPQRVPCYDGSGRAQRCFAPFVNAAFNLTVEATNTCGMLGEEHFCEQTGISGATKYCDICDNRRPDKAHPPQYLTDFQSVDSIRWWQSSTMLEDVQWPNSVNLTLHLGKAFEITYVRLKFHSSRPESFAIYKRTSENGTWIPFQFYSATCQETYRLPVSAIIHREHEAQAICEDDYSDISPLTGGSIAFSTLSGRPSAHNFEHSPVLQEWVTATDIRIVLNRINTFRDEVFGDPNVLRSYFYAISDFAVGGRCKCNGHASECTKQTDQRLEDRLVCQCEHKTTGPDCNECLPFYNDRPWKRATATDAFECQPCNCSGQSNHCYFDMELFRRTGHGGHCIDCRENTFGPNCERCKESFYRRTESDTCKPCNCHPVGSRQKQCDSNGQCLCKPGVVGDKCDKCQTNYFDFSITGCRPCQCLVAGSLNNRPDCASETGICKCKENVEGQNCDTCKRGFFGLSEDDPQGCMACFCYGHSSICTSSPGYTTRVVHSDFESGLQRWRGETRGLQETHLEYNARAGGHIGISSDSSDASYFIAPDRYLGDHRHSYNLFLSFTLWIGEEGVKPSIADIIIEGGGLRVSSPIFAQGNHAPRTVKEEYRFRLNEHPSYQWTPRLSSVQFMRILSNITLLKIRGTYGSRGIGFLDNVRLQSAREGSGGTPAVNVEQCTCPEGYVGQFCESCAPGYRKDPAGGGPFDRCVPCNCNRHSDTCHPTTGRCICEHNTAGLNCERCAPGFYGYALAGTPHDCKPCPCPENGDCVELLDGRIGCVNCREGYTGHRCELCQDGYFGDPEGRHGQRRQCTRCMCNENIDTNAVGNCNRTTGECLKCIYNTVGFHCERCLLSYYGDALALPKGQCKACNCYGPGTVRSAHSPDCDNYGRCRCHSNVIGLTCNQCLDSYWNIDSGSGCESCNCHRIGSLNASCELRTGQCFCKPGVTGQRCDRCADRFYGLSPDGCKACNCRPEGSRTLLCNQQTGACECKPNIDGRTCDSCAENKYDISAGCLDCPVCYNLIQANVRILRQKISELRLVLENIHKNPGVVDDADFRRKLEEVNAAVIRLWQDSKRYTGDDGSLGDQMDMFRMAVVDLTHTLTEITDSINTAMQSSQRADIDTAAAQRAVDQAERALQEAERHLKVDGGDTLRMAKEAQEMMGHQSERMTRIASEARREAERQEELAERIEKTAKDALSTSEDALRTAQEALARPSGVADDITKIKREVSSTGSLFNETKKLAEGSLKRAQDVYKDSLSVYTDVDALRTITVNVSSATEEINQIKDQAGKIKKEANDLITEHHSLLTNVNNQIREGEEYYHSGEQQQQITDELLADADAARSMAEKAVAKAEGILLHAKQTLQTLKDFDRTVNDNKAEAQEALRSIGAIRQHISNAENKTREARFNLADAETDAQLANATATMARATAGRTWHQISVIKNETEITKLKMVEVEIESEQLTEDLDRLEERLQDLERQAEDEAKLAKEALEKADNATTAAESASNTVTGALSTVNDIISQLDNLDTIDLVSLTNLERSLNETEQRLAAENIEVRYKELEDLNRETERWLIEYATQLHQLTLDVENIRDINATIPRQCFKNVVIEPTERPRLPPPLDPRLG